MNRNKNKKMNNNSNKDNQEMVQLDHGDYVFDEYGRGTPASTFFKKLATYNNRSSSPSRDDSDRIIGAAYSHADMLKME